MKINPINPVNYINYINYIILILIFSATLKAEIPVDLKIGAYADAYIATDNDNLPNPWDQGTALAYTPRQYTFLNAKKGQMDINIAQISCNLAYQDKARGKVTLQYGTLAERAYSNYAVQEAFIGMRIVDNLWVDAGYFLTHIGGESYLPKDNWLSTHSLVTYYEPFYHAGVKITYSNDKFTAGLHLLNGNGVFNDNNDNKSVGVYLAYSFSDLLNISYASIFGNEEPGGSNNAKTHTLNNICLNSKLSSKVELKGQFDLATKERVKPDGNYFSSGLYYGASLSGRYSFSDLIRASVRFSYTDDTEFVYASGIKGFESALGIEYKPVDKAYIRLECGFIQFDEGKNKEGNVFHDSNNKAVNSRFSANLNFGIWFD